MTISTCSLPRIGVVLTLRPGFERLEWDGPGPVESYADRQASAIDGRWRSTVTEEYVPYVMPQEHGQHVGVRRVAAYSFAYVLRRL